MHFLITVLLVLSFSINSATAAAVDSLQSAFDDLNYSLQVEWDQKDVAFHDEQVLLFQSRMAKLKEQGLTDQEIISFALSSIKDQKVVNELTEMANVLSVAQLPSEQVEELLRSYVSKQYNQGASWYASTGPIIFGVLAVLVVVIAVVGSDDKPHCLAQCSK